ncbi:hypothetical protein BC827DRAFT_1225089 [Russula dissimulans]|nr:hypothetical protein BC827DRAFT_1225089 [Russula dissimulans]
MPVHRPQKSETTSPRGHPHGEPQRDRRAPLRQEPKNPNKQRGDEQVGGEHTELHSPDRRVENHTPRSSERPHSARREESGTRDRTDLRTNQLSQPSRDAPFPHFIVSSQATPL